MYGNTSYMVLACETSLVHFEHGPLLRGKPAVKRDCLSEGQARHAVEANATFRRLIDEFQTNLFIYPRPKFLGGISR
jgi:hypothetical protein